MWKKFRSKFPDLEKQGEFMQAGDVSIRETLQAIVPFSRDDSRETWFYRVAHRVGIPKSRVKSLFYNRQCRLWGDELVRITGAVQLHHNPDLNELFRQLEDLQNRQEAFKNDLQKALAIKSENLARH